MRSRSNESSSSPATSAPALNFTITRSGLAAAICLCCGRRSRPVTPCSDGEPDLFEMPMGWSQAPYPNDFAHPDGSHGSQFHCPACNKRLHAGERLQHRAYLAAEVTR